MGTTFESWGRYPTVEPSAVVDLAWTQDLNLRGVQTPVLAYGKGRSYGDVCLNEQGTIVSMDRCTRIREFDRERGIITAEAGLSIQELLRVIVPHGWFVPVTPGTKYVTLGGAVANDVHGKNHHRVGTFGCHVTAFTLVRTDGTVMDCSPQHHAEMFAATIGGLGLTGIIATVTLQLIPIASRMIDEESIKSRSLRETIDLTISSDEDWDYTVSWIDVLASGAKLGKGLVLRGNFSAVADGTLRARWKDPLLKIPLEGPSWLLSKPTIAMFNTVWYGKQFASMHRRHIDLEPFFYPLDAVDRWNLLYGKRGMLQYQCVVPLEGGEDAMRRILSTMQGGGISSFLAVLKMFGNVASPGVMSFPRPGLTLTLDMPIGGKRMLDALDRCDAIVHEMGGRIYPAKDARVQGSMFRAMYAQELAAFQPYIDPGMSSSFWRRVTQE
jgi:FAD/FMN-containing dehydrogenase